jgi:hypothetical protein
VSSARAWIDALKICAFTFSSDESWSNGIAFSVLSAFVQYSRRAALRGRIDRREPAAFPASELALPPVPLLGIERAEAGVGGGRVALRLRPSGGGEQCSTEAEKRDRASDQDHGRDLMVLPADRRGQERYRVFKGPAAL